MRINPSVRLFVFKELFKIQPLPKLPVVFFLREQDLATRKTFSPTWSLVYLLSQLTNKRENRETWVLRWRREWYLVTFRHRTVMNLKIVPFIFSFILTSTKAIPCSFYGVLDQAQQNDPTQGSWLKFHRQSIPSFFLLLRYDFSLLTASSWGLGKCSVSVHVCGP